MTEVVKLRYLLHSEEFKVSINFKFRESQRGTSSHRFIGGSFQPISATERGH